MIDAVGSCVALLDKEKNVEEARRELYFMLMLVERFKCSQKK